MDWNEEQFREKINREHRFPGPYVFKFIINHERKDKVVNMLPAGELNFKYSSNRKYTSITLKCQIQNSSQVVEIYKKVSEIDGLIAL